MSQLLLATVVLHAALQGPLPYRTSGGSVVRVAMDAAPQPVRTAEMQAVIDELANRERRNAILALGSTVVASAFYGFQRANPADPVKLLRLMESESLPLREALKNGRPTVVEFYAPWCESCKLGARDMLKLERTYGGQVNFVTIDGDDPSNAQLVSRVIVDHVLRTATSEEMASPV